MARYMTCKDCGGRINTAEAYCLQDKTAEAICIDCADSYYDVTLVDSGQVIEKVSTWTGNGPMPKRQAAQRFQDK